MSALIGTSMALVCFSMALISSGFGVWFCGGCGVACLVVAAVSVGSDL